LLAAPALPSSALPVPVKIEGQVSPAAAPLSLPPAASPHEDVHLQPAPRSDGTRAGDLRLEADRWRRLAELAEAAAARREGDLLADQAHLWQAEVALYDKRLADLGRDLVTVEAARPVVATGEVQRRLAAGEDMQHVAAHAAALIAAAKAELHALTGEYQAGRADRQALLQGLAVLRKTPANARATLARSRQQAALSAVRSPSGP